MHINVLQDCPKKNQNAEAHFDTGVENDEKIAKQRTNNECICMNNNFWNILCRTVKYYKIYHAKKFDFVCYW